MLLGAVGGPKWDDPNAKTRPEKGLLAIRKGLGLFANLRPVKSYTELLDSSPLKRERVEGVNLLVRARAHRRPLLRQAGIASRPASGVRAYDTLEYTDFEIERIVRARLRDRRAAAGRR